MGGGGGEEEGGDKDGGGGKGGCKDVGNKEIHPWMTGTVLECP